MLSVRVLSVLTLTSVLYASWVLKLDRIVPAPYLDEYFHIRQAQAYCEGRFAEWDSKITTPPGLYLISYGLGRLSRLLSGLDGCTVTSLRLLNTFTTVSVLPVQIWDLSNDAVRRKACQRSADLFHTVLNICLFPLVFFLSGLYYTDVCSVSFVLAAFQFHRRSLRGDGSTRLLDGLKVFVAGVGALSVRQTNIFWVAVFLAGLQAVHDVKASVRSQPRRHNGHPNPSLAIHDPPVRQAYLEEYLQTAFSLATTALREPIILLRGLWPYIALLASFAVFVLFNGGVVLGDKENHVASIHTPQMLYLWPYIIFFSWPIILPHVLHTFAQHGRESLPRFSLAIPIMAVMAIAVRFNTTVHPFTLADNRHYVFYVFRLLLRHPLIKFAAVPIYFSCAWAAITALGSANSPHRRRSGRAKPIGNPSGNETERKSQSPSQSQDEDTEPTRTSFLIVYLASTALSLITAPLVEPRYFIIPWLIWRLHVQPPPSPQLLPPSPARKSHRTKETEGAKGSLVRSLDHLLHLDPSIWLSLETAWFLLVNSATGLMFLYRGFEWAQEPGVVQRFMW